jgi:hypothetical protein
MRDIKRLNGKLIVLKQTGNTITGSIGSKSNWIINGTREGNIIKFYIIRGNEINGSWEINADATKLEGKWLTTGAGGASGKWNLTKIENDVAPIPDISGTYTSEITTESNSFPFINHKIPEVTIVQKGNQITGTYHEGRGKIWGDIDGNTIKFEWFSPEGVSGIGKWTIKPGGSEITGSWFENSRGTGKWNLTKIENDVAQVPDISGTYISEITADSQRFPLKNPVVMLVQKGNEITGSFREADGNIWGRIEGDTIYFDWDLATYMGTGKWTIKPGGNEITGNWFSSGLGTGKWNLTKIE